MTGDLKLTSHPLDIAVIGAGISGLTCADLLQRSGHRVTVLEKSRGVGGRMATRRAGEGIAFDHGAQYFTIRDKRFLESAVGWLEDEVISIWRGRIRVIEGDLTTTTRSSHDRFVATPRMNSLCKHLAADLDVRLRCRVQSLQRQASKWHLATADGESLGPFDIVLLSAPAPQTAELLRGSADFLADQAASVTMTPCWSLMTAFADSLPMPFDAAFVNHSPIAWIARNSSKPQREPLPDTWVLHASTGWSIEHVEGESSEIQTLLLAALHDLLEHEFPELVHCAVHRWRYALPAQPLPQICLYDPGLNIGACGDWCGQPRVEGAFLSGLALYERIMESATDT